MKRMISYLLGMLGFTTACGQQGTPSVTDNKERIEHSDDTFDVDRFKTKNGKSVTFYALMHGSIRINFDGKELYIDPVTKLGARTVDFSTMPKADYIFVTHEHADHLDKAAVDMLSTDGTLLVTNSRCASMLGKGEVMKNGEKMKIAEDFIVEAVPAYNTTERHLQFHPKGRDNGFILTLDGLRVYIAGDTEDIPEMTSFKNIDIAFLPCNQPYTMTVEQLVKATQTIKPAVLFPYHYGQTNVQDIPQLLKASDVDVRIRHYE